MKNVQRNAIIESDCIFKSNELLLFMFDRIWNSVRNTLWQLRQCYSSLSNFEAANLPSRRHKSEVVAYSYIKVAEKRYKQNFDWIFKWIPRSESTIAAKRRWSSRITMIKFLPKPIFKWLWYFCLIPNDQWRRKGVRFRN